MTRIPDETRRKVICTHIQNGRTIAGLVTECGVSKSIVFNQVRLYREECQNNGEEKSRSEMMEELRRLRREKAGLEEESSFLEKQ